MVKSEDGDDKEVEVVRIGKSPWKKFNGSFFNVDYYWGRVLKSNCNRSLKIGGKLWVEEKLK